MFIMQKYLLCHVIIICKIILSSSEIYSKNFTKTLQSLHKQNLFKEDQSI